MQVKRRRLPDFETCSVALFATLVLSGPLAPRAQQVAFPRASVAVKNWVVMPAPGPVMAASPPTAPADRGPTGEQLDAPFARADGDGPLYGQGAPAQAGVSRLFDPVDRNRDGSISSAGFDESLK